MKRQQSKRLRAFRRSANNAGRSNNKSPAWKQAYPKWDDRKEVWP